MTASSLLWWYIEAAAVLAVSHLLWISLRGPLMRAGSASLLRSLLRGLLVAALLTPLFVGVFPRPSLRGMTPSTEAGGSRQLRPAITEDSDSARFGGVFTWVDHAGWEAWHKQALATFGVACLLAGFGVHGLRLWREFLRLRRLIRESVPLHRIGRVRIAVSDRTPVSFSTVVFARADVIVPVEILEHPRDLKLVLRHELQHHRTADPIWGALADSIRVLFFWHPAAHAWANELTIVAEMGCDEALISRGVPLRSYLDCLVRVAETVLETRAPLFASSAMAPGRGRGSNPTQFQRRIDMLTRPCSRRSFHRLALAAAMLMAIGTLAAGYGAALARPNAPDKAVSPSSVASEGTQVTITTKAPPGEVTVLAAVGDCPEGAVVISAEDCQSLLGEEAEDCTPRGTGEQVSDSAWREGAEIELTTRDGEPVLLSDLRGQVVLIDYWASWCGFCWTEAGHLKDLHREFGSAGFEVVGVSLDREREGFERFIEANDLPWPQRLASGAWRDPAVSAFEVHTLPAHILIDREGNWTQLPIRGPEALRASVEYLVQHGGVAPLQAY